MNALAPIRSGAPTAYSLPSLPQKQLRFPIVISEFRRNAREVWRISLDEYKGTPTIDLRAWWRDQGGNLNPGKSGLTASVKHLEAFAVGIANALMMARELGLLDD